jgi:hypothetical protein
MLLSHGCRISARFILPRTPAVGYCGAMLCEQKTNTQWPLENSEVQLTPENKLRLHAAMVASGAVLYRLRRRKLHNDWMARHKGIKKTYARRHYLRKRLVILGKAPDESLPKTTSPELRSVLRGAAATLRKLREQARVRGWFGSHKKKVAVIARRYYERHYDEIHERLATPERRKRRTEVGRVYLRNRRRENIQVNLATRLRARIGNALRCNGVKKNALSVQLLGCTIAEAKAHIEAQFKPGMNWEDKSSYVLDHRCPISAFDLRDDEEVKVAFNYRNLQPLTRFENASKHATVTFPLAAWIPAHIAMRVVERAAKTLRLGTGASNVT